MKKFDVQMALEGIAEARHEWARAKMAFDTNVEKMMRRLLHEAAANKMSAEEFARYSGLTTKRVRVLMRKVGLNPASGKTLLAKTAADALASNAELLGVEVHAMDLTSPLAYLPMGEQMRLELQEKAVSRVTELPEVSGNSQYELADFNPDGHLHKCSPSDCSEDCAAHLYAIAQDAGL